MSLGRAVRGVVALVGGCLPAVLAWILLVFAIDHRHASGSAAASPNPVKVTAWQLGWFEVLVYADPYLAANIYLWLVPGTALLAGLGLWAAGIPVLRKGGSVDWPVPGFRKVIYVSLAIGIFLAAPWLYACVCVLGEASP